MHRAYQSVLPTSNKLLQQKWDTTYYKEHRKKVQEAAPMVDTKAPSTYMHLHLKLKKLQLEEERLATIERDNRILLEKMSYIMRTQGRVDNRNSYEYKSLNREKRQRELLRVTKENQSILRRITMRQPEYSSQIWKDDWQKNQLFMDSISSYPPNWWVRENTKSGKGKRSRSQNKNKRDEDGRQSKQSNRSNRDNQDDVQKSSDQDQSQQKQTEQQKA